MRTRRFAARLDQGVGEANNLLSRLSDVGVSFDDISRQLEEDGIEKFGRPYDHLLETLRKRSARN